MVKTNCDKNRRVVVTGLGVVSSLGIGWKEFWKNLLAGRSGINPITSFDVSKHDRIYGGEVKNFDPTKFINKKKARQMGKASQFAITAAQLAIKDAGLKIEELRKSRTGICIGTTMGEIQVIEQIIKHTLIRKQAIKQIRALISPASSISVNLAGYFKLNGPNLLFSTACAAGNYSLGYAFDLIKSGRADYILAGGSDALSRIAFTGFSRVYSMAPKKCQPFDKNRKGMMLGEGAGILVIESLESAKKRGLRGYAEILGYGLSCDARHMTRPSSQGIVNSITKSLASSLIETSAIDYISAHGTGTKENDKVECEAFKNIFHEELKNIPVSSIKSMLGHTMGAAAALESVACCLAIFDSQIPPTINMDNQDSECEIDCVPNRSRLATLKVVLNNSQAFGGNNACVSMGKI